MTQQQTMQAILDKIIAYDTIIITRHVRPDGDAIGSSNGDAPKMRSLEKTAACSANSSNMNTMCSTTRLTFRLSIRLSLPPAQSVANSKSVMTKTSVSASSSASGVMMPYAL